MIDPRLTEQEQGALERVCGLVARSLDEGIAGGQDADREVALGVIARDLAILQTLHHRSLNAPRLVLPPRAS